MSKGFDSQPSPKLTQRQKAYFKLIKKLLSCPGGGEMKILKKNSHLVDIGLLETVEIVIEVLTKKNELSSVNFLRNFADWLVQNLGLSRVAHSETANFYRPPAFLGNFLWVSARHLSNPQGIYPFLKANLDQLNESFYEQFCRWLNSTLLTSKPKEEIVLVITAFCTALGQFPLGDRAINLEISITGLEAAAKIFTRDVSPENWAHIQANLVPPYRHRIRGNRADNLEKAILACNNALLIYTRDSFPEKWAYIQNNLGLVYTDRIKGDNAENLEKAISCYETALQDVSRAQFSELLGTLQNNLANAYLFRIQGDKAQNLEKAIACYQVALQVRIRSASPYYWASSQQNLGNAYSERILGNRQQNLEKAISAYINALEVYTISDYPERWAATQSGLGNAYRQTGQITEALECFRAALQVLTPTSFPRYCISTALSLGDTAFAAGMKSEAFESYAVAIEAIEQNRRWANISYDQEVPQEFLAYLKIVTFCLANGERNKAREYAERSGLQDILNLLDSDEFQFQISNSQFLDQLFKETYESNGESQAVYQILENNLDKLNEQFVQTLQVLNNDLRQMMSLGQAIEFAATLCHFSDIIEQFPKGDKAINLKIAATGYEVAANVFNQQDFPEQWENIQARLRELLIIQLSLKVFEISKCEILENVSHQHQNNLAILYPLLEANKDKLDERFARILRLNTTAMLSEVPPEYAKGIAANLLVLSLIIQDFPQGKEANKLEIALTGCEITSTILTREAFPLEWGSCQTLMGNVYNRRYKGERAENIERAIAHLQNALQVHTPAQFPQQWAETQRNLLSAYGNRIRGDQAENAELAISAGEAAMQVYNRHDFPEEWAAVQNNLGIIYRDRVFGDKAENLEQAIACYQNALLIRTREDFPELWAETQMNLGSVYRLRLRGDEAENVEMAIIAYQSALQVYTKELFLQDWARVQINLANAYLYRIHGEKSKNLEMALAAHESVVPVFTPDEFPYYWAVNQINLGNVYLAQEQKKKAINCYRLALTVFTPTSFPQECLKTGQMLGDTAYGVGRWSEAIEGYSVAIEALEISRTWTSSESRRQEILTESFDIYFTIVQACINNQQLAKAVEYVERSRSKQLVDLIASNDLYSDGNINPQIQQYLQDFENIQRQIDNEQSRHSSNIDRELVSKKQENRAAITAYNETIATLEADKQLIWEQIRRLDPVLAGQIQVSPIKLSSIQQLIDQPTTAILSFYTTFNDTHIFIIRQNQISLHTCHSMGLTTLQESIFNYWLGQYINDQNNWKESFNSFTAELAKALQLKDIITQHLKEISEIIIVPHLALHYIPFAALPIGEGEYLGDKFLLRCIPSCQILEFCQNRPSVGTLLNYGTVEDATEDLPYASFEGEQLANLYNIPNNQRLKGSQQAKVSKYRELLQKVQGLHSSHHAQSRLDNPLESALILGDGRLTLGQLITPAWRFYQLEEVFLSCCETGLGTIEITDNILTFATAFICAGAKSVISTLWAVDDLATALFSLFYYQHRHRGNNRPESIRQAQFDLRNLTGEALTTIYKPKLIDFLTQQLKETHALRKKAQKEREKYLQDSELYQQWQEESQKHDQIGKLLYKAKNNLEHFCQDIKPFSHPFYWAAFICSGWR